MWAELVAGIKSRDPQALEDLYRIVLKLRGLVRTSLADDPNSHINEIWLRALDRITLTEFRSPEHLENFVRTIARRYIFLEIGKLSVNRHRFLDCEEEDGTPIDLADHQDETSDAPDKAAYMCEIAAIIDLVLAEITNPVYRTILMMRYVEDGDDQDVMRELNLYGRRYLVVKHRARKQFREAMLWRLRGGRRLRAAA